MLKPRSVATSHFTGTGADAEELVRLRRRVLADGQRAFVNERSLSRLGEWGSDLERLKRLTLHIRAATDANASGAFLEVSLRHLMGSLLDLQEVVAVLSSAPAGAESMRSLELSKALKETVEVLEKTKRTFKSKDLGDLRQKLESVLAVTKS